MVWMVEDGFVEGLHVLNDGASGLRGVVAVHSTALGPAAGGCRFWCYADQQDLVTDAIRLARGMSYKNALAGLPFGGGKAVLQRPGTSFDRDALFRAFGNAVEALGGSYVTAEDVGTSVADMRRVRTGTAYVAGLETDGGAAGGDPSPWTARGVFESMAAVADILGLDLSDSTVAVQGAGNVGGHLARLLARAGARLIVADVDAARARALAEELGAEQVAADAILTAEADILAPCALGAVLNDATIPALRIRAVCGAANNQLEGDRHGELLRGRGILYAPDYVVNAGGIINVCAEYLGEQTGEVEARVGQIAPRLREIVRLAGEREQPTNQVADALAREAIASARRLAA